jgi:hypothetical protein
LTTDATQSMSLEGDARFRVLLHDLLDGHLFMYHRKLL